MDRSWACCSPSLVIVARIVFGPEIGVLLDLDDPSQGLYGLLRNVLPFILLGISALLLLTETTRLIGLDSHSVGPAVGSGEIRELRASSLRRDISC